jgi:hypothetical protein
MQAGLSGAQIKNINQIMDSLCQIKIPAHIISVWVDNKDLIEKHFEVSDKLEAEAQRLTNNQATSQKKVEEENDYIDNGKSTIKVRSGLTSSSPKRSQRAGVIANNPITPLKMSPRFS